MPVQSWTLKACRSVHASYLRSGHNTEGQDSTRNARTRAQLYFAINQVVYLKGLGMNVVISHQLHTGDTTLYPGWDGEVLPDEKSTFVGSWTDKTGGWSPRYGLLPYRVVVLFLASCNTTRLVFRNYQKKFGPVGPSTGRGGKTKGRPIQTWVVKQTWRDSWQTQMLCRVVCTKSVVEGMVKSSGGRRYFPPSVPQEAWTAHVHKKGRMDLVI